ncbi:MAG: hypothetical protein K8R87_12955 [Verrucomicrobia bacterium]|nr:hypothetical protein [Verrucomicrobiota bacterium]
MFKKIHFLFVFAFALPAASYGKGPWDNGDYSQFLDESGIYQAAMRFKNGSGFAQWGTNVALADTSTAGGTGAVTSSLKISSPIDRSVIYYKGIVFVGNATGMVDHVRKSIIGITNSYANFTSTTSATGGGGGSVSATSTIVQNGAIANPLTANTVFNATINQTAPILKFNGTGQLSVVDASAVAPTTTPVTPAPRAGALADVTVETISMRVVGSRIFQSSTR